MQIVGFPMGRLNYVIIFLYTHNFYIMLHYSTVLDHCWTPNGHFSQFLLYSYIYSHYNLNLKANTDICLDSTNSVIMRLWCIYVSNHYESSSHFICLSKIILCFCSHYFVCFLMMYINHSLHLIFSYNFVCCMSFYIHFPVTLTSISINFFTMTNISTNLHLYFH